MQSTSHSHKATLISVDFTICIENLDLLGNGLKREEEEERGRIFCSHGRHVGVTNCTKDGSSGKWTIFFFRFLPGPQNQCARRTRNREINHHALPIEAHHLFYKLPSAKVGCVCTDGWLSLFRRPSVIVPKSQLLWHESCGVECKAITPSTKDKRQLTSDKQKFFLIRQAMFNLRDVSEPLSAPSSDRQHVQGCCQKPSICSSLRFCN